MTTQESELSKQELQNLFSQPPRHGAEEMDEIRQQEIAYQYLCRLQEAKKWMEAVLHEELPAATHFEEALRNGVYLAKLANFMSPETMPLSRIYDLDQQRYNASGLQYRHTDNINHWIKSLETMNLSKQFHPETNDVYNKKNMPRVIYCIHALSRHLFRLGKAPLMHDLYGKALFTEAEIDGMSKQLRDCSHKMPAFQKIGGLLASEMPVDLVALHAAIVAINEALEKEDTAILLEALQNPIVCLIGVLVLNVDRYHAVMRSAKHKKVEIAQNKSLSESYTADEYDELLTQDEIQGHIASVNVLQAWDEVLMVVKKGDVKALLKALSVPVLGLEAVKEKCGSLYMAELSQRIEEEAYNNDMDSLECRLQLQKAITVGNTCALEEAKSVEAVWHVNQALSQGVPLDTLRALQNPALNLYEIIPEAASLYHEEMRADKIESGGDLSLLEIQSCIHLLSHVAAVTHAVDSRSPDLMWKTLKKFEGMMDTEETLKEQYWKALNTCREKKKTECAKCPFLTFFDIHDSINEVNKKVNQQNQMVSAMHNLNKAITEKSQSETITALQTLAVGLKEKVDLHEAPLYYKILQEILEHKEKDNKELWLQDAQFALSSAKKEAAEANKACIYLVRLHRAMEAHIPASVLDALQSGNLEDEPLYPDLSSTYLKTLLECHKQKVSKGYSGPSVLHITSQGHKVLLNLKEISFEWKQPESSLEKTPFLSLREVKKLVKMINSEMKTTEDTESDETEENFTDSQQQLINIIIKIQSWWRGIRAKRQLVKLKLEKKKRSEPRDLLQMYRKHVDKIILIQSMWRGRQTRKDFQSLVHQPAPSLAIIRNFGSFLIPSPQDFERENEIQQRKSQVVKMIRLNQQLSQHIDDMDIKIGLLIQNRISLQDVQAHSVSLSDLAGRHHSSQELTTASTSTNSTGTLSNTNTLGKGLKSLTKEGRHLLEGYQNLFYLLQTKPHYLAKLLFCLPHSRSMHFLQNVIFTLYNFGTDERDEYLLLKLLRSALEEEIKSKFQKPIDVLKVYPQVLRISINFSREHTGRSALRAILGPLVQKVLNDKSLCIETNPVDIYKTWINNMEMATGQPCELPRVVSQEEALQHEEVRKRLEKGISELKAQTISFLDHICESRDVLPYSLLYTARTLYNALAKRFPGFPEKDLLKVVGNAIYYHFINAAIVAPDAYDIITLPADKTLTSEERSNLASIAKILQYAASKKGFGDESRHLTTLNPFIIECHEKFKKFLSYCCQVEELEDHFGVHAYSEATMIVKPTILISLQEIWDTHQLVLQYEDEIASGPNDVLHSLLEDLGPLSSVRKLLGASSSEGFLPKGDIFLTLSNSKMEVASQSGNSDDPDQNQLFVMSKELLVSILPFLPGNNLMIALDTPELICQEEQFAAQQQTLHRESGTPTTSLRLSKMRLRLWLSQLERQGRVSAKDNYQALISSVAKDICTRGQYCQAKTKELQMLKATINSLEEKTQFYQKQVEFYNMYIRTCLQNLDTGKRRVHQLRVSSKHPGKAKSHKVLKYSAAQLHAKGVLQQMRGLTPAQFKSVQFEIAPTTSVGVFEVKGCFMGVEIERVDIDIQHLLQLQYEGKAIMDMFGKVQINVNLLLFLLNKKFYGKS